jgi:septal ring factor EnvC (AmiA/AmiB activator)
VFEGEVVFQDWLQGYGHTVILDHHHGYLSVYAHLAEPAVRFGQRVARGGALGGVGDSGSLEGPQLYFELRRDGLPLDPAPWLAAGLQRAERNGGRP